MKINFYRFRLFCLLAIAFLVPSIICGVILYHNSQEDLKAYTSENIQYTLASNVANVESKLDTMDAASTSMLIALAQNPSVMVPDSHLEGSDLYQSTLYSFTTHTSLINDTYTIDGFNHFYLYFPYRSLLLVSNMSSFEDVTPNTLDCHFVPEEQWGIAAPYENVVSNPKIGQVSSERNFVKNHILEDKMGNELILTSCVKESYVNRLLSSNFQITPSYTVVLNPYGVPLSSMEPMEIGNAIPTYYEMMDVVLAGEESSYHQVFLDEKPYLLNWVYSADNDWYYILATNLNTVLNGSTTLPSLLIPIIFCAFALAFLLTCFLCHQIRRPAQQLCSAMDQFPQQKNIIPLLEKAQSRGELAPVFDSFTHMTARMSAFINDMSLQNDIQKLAKIQLLQTEINPHMLYNSLESLYSIARINGQEEIADLVMALSRFFRIALSGGKRSVPFRDAFELANQYITVQNIRVNYKISFTYSIAEEIYDLSVPKFLIQPLVENAILHGFKNKRDEWSITLTAEIEDGHAVIRIFDNGIGISESDLNKLNRKINDFNFENSIENKGYALRNLNYQIKLKYAEGSGIFLTSVYGEGTEAVIRLALKKNRSETTGHEEASHV